MARRTPFVAGNWKMHLLQDGARGLVRALIPALRELRYVRTAVCPPFTSLGAVRELIAGTPIALGAQNCHDKESGAFTGEVAPAMLRDAGCEHVILGHSERRRYFDEIEPFINAKLLLALAAGLKPILCVGETEAEREAGQTTGVVERQVRGCLEGLKPEGAAERLTVAYEPVWAIGTGKTATPQQAQEVHSLIRRLLGDMLGADTAAQVVIQYGGSVTEKNAAELLAQPDIDGALVGGASLKADAFIAICEAANAARR